MKIRMGVVLLVAVLGTVQAVSTQDNCDFSDVDAEQMAQNVLRKLPYSYTNPDVRPEELFLGITLGAPEIKGANIFKIYGPVSSYCRNGDRFVQVDIVADNPVDYFAPWKICNGKEGVIGAQGTARFTVTFEVANATAQGEPHAERKRIIHTDLTPVSTHINAVYLRGAGDLLKNAVGYSRFLLPGISAEVWGGCHGV
ncbi:hypothetical protein MTO96_029604 [Rhipicephalus appendiculatus]